MNMIVNKSDLVGYEAVETKAAKKEALAKLVAAWESKQAQNARRFGGLGFLAVSLAACNSSDDDTTTTTTTTTTTETTTVASGITPTLTDDDTAGVSVDVITGTSSADTITGTQATLDTSDVITDSTSGDGDTLNVNATAAVSSPSIVNGVENVNYNMTTFGAGVAIAVDNVYGANITVNNLQLGGTDNIQVTGLGNGSTLNFGSQTAGVVNGHTVTGGTGAGTINAGTGAVTVTAISADGMTINAVDGSEVNLEGAAATAPVTVSAASGVTVTIDADNDDAGDAISMLTLSGAGTFTVDDAADAYTMSGAAGTISAANTEVTGLVLTDSTTSGTSTLAMAEITGTGVTVDLDEIAVDAVTISDDGTSTGANIISVASGTTVNLSGALANGITIQSDQTVTGAAADTAETLTLNVSANVGQTIVVSDYETLTITTSGTNTALAFTAGAITATLNGSTTLALGAATATAIDASGYTGAITHTANSGQAGTVTYGSGDDSVTATTAQVLVLDGGAGNDTLTIPADADEITATNFEVYTQAAVTSSLASQWSGDSAIINGGNLIQISSVDVSTIDLSGFTMAVAAGDRFELTVGTNSTVDATKLASSVGLTITGSSGNDIFTGTDNADTITGGAGTDTITGAGGIDSLTGGAGVDTFEFANAHFTATTAAALGAAADKITDFAASSATATADGDAIGWDAAGSVVTAATAAVAGTAQVATAGAAAAFHADDDTLAERITAVEAITGGTTDGEAVLFGHGSNSYVFISDNADGVTASDGLIELTGFDSTGKTLEALAAGAVGDFIIY